MVDAQTFEMDEQRESRGALASRLLRWRSDGTAKVLTRACYGGGEHGRTDSAQEL